METIAIYLTPEQLKAAAFELCDSPEASPWSHGELLQVRYSIVSAFADRIRQEIREKKEE